MASEMISSDNYDAVQQPLAYIHTIKDNFHDKREHSNGTNEKSEVEAAYNLIRGANDGLIDNVLSIHSINVNILKSHYNFYMETCRSESANSLSRIEKEVVAGERFSFFCKTVSVLVLSVR